MPAYYELDDFQVRTPTDIVGQHIHLVKFDVTSSDGAVNGFNYQDGSYSPDEVRSRIDAINAGHGLYNFDLSRQDHLEARPTPAFGDVGPNGQAWRRADYRTTLVRRPARQQAAGDHRIPGPIRGSHPPVGLHARPLQPHHPPAGRPVRGA